MKRRKNVIIAIAAILLACVSIPFVTFIALYCFVLTPEKLTNLLTQEVNERTHILFDCRRIELNYMDSWPSISLSIHDGKARIPAQTPDSVTDILDVRFKRASGNIQFLKLLKEQTLCIENILIDEPDLFLELDRPLPPILKEEKREKQGQQILFDIKRINVSDAHLHLRNGQKGFEAEACRTSVSAKGNLTAAQPSFDIEASCPTLRCKTKGVLPKQDLSFSLQGHCNATEHFNDLTLKDTRFFLNRFPFEIEGSLHNAAKGGDPFLEMRFGLLASKLEELFEFIPKEYLPEKKTYSVKGSTALKGEIKGRLKEGTLPDIYVEGVIGEGSFHKTGIKQGIDTISLNLELSYREKQPDSCFLALHNVKVKGLNSSIQMENRITNLKGIPFITGDLKGHIDFDCIGQEFILPQLATLHGQMTSDLSFAFNLKDLQEGNLNRLWADGSLQTNRIEVRSPRYRLDAFISGMTMDLGYKKNRSDFITQAEVLNGTADIDSLKIAYDRSVFLNLSQLHLRSNTALSKDTSALVPVTVHLDCAILQAKLDKRNWVSAEGLELHAGTKPSLADKRSPEGALVLKANALKYLDAERQNAVVLGKGEFVTELRPKAKTDRTTSKWDAKGMLNFDGSQVYSAYFPLKVNLGQTRLSFQNNQFILNRLPMQAGKSNYILSGMLHANPAPKAQEPKLEGAIHIWASTIDYDELKQAFLYGEALSREHKAGTISSLTLDNLEQKLKPKAHAKIEERLIYIPEGVQLDVQLDVENMNYHEIALQQVCGNIFIKDRKAYSQLSTRTNLGKASLSMLYDSQRQKDVKAYFDLNLKDVLVGQMHKAVPTVEYLLPLTKSMDGLIDCRLTAEGRLDNRMLPILSTAKAACSIGGQKLILIDNATFDEIAHKFKFKNKKRNQLDKLSANLILQDNHIEVIPFLMEWDRYQAVIGGTHSTDFTYNYHLTMLKSPIPIDFGINLSGKAGELKYKIGKCKYKDLYKDRGSKHLQQTEQRMESIRQTIISKIKL